MSALGEGREKDLVAKFVHVEVEVHVPQKKLFVRFCSHERVKA